MSKRKMTQAEAQKALPSIKEFNGIAGKLLRLLSQKAQIKEKRLGNIRLLLNEFRPPASKNLSTINIQTVDMRNTVIKKGSGFSYNKTMNWEDDLRQKRRGAII